MTRRLLAGVTALLVALCGVVSVVAYARTADRRALAGQQAVRVFVAVRGVPAGTTAGTAVAQGLIVPELVARRAVPDGVLTSIEGGYDQLVATSAIQPGELVFRARFAARGTTRGALLVPEGLLAVSVALDDPAHVGPFVTVGSKVAVLDTFNVRETGASPSGGAGRPGDPAGDLPAGDPRMDQHEYVRATRVLVPSVEVLAVGTSTTTVTPPASADGKAASGGAGEVTVFTLAVTQAQAEVLVHAVRTGTLTFALLGPGSGATAGPGVDDRSLFTTPMAQVAK
jgi:pilus assembly protein CpaB